MEGEACDEVCTQPRVKSTFRLGTETYSVEGNKGCLSEQLVRMKEDSMCILKDFITKHNVPNDVPDEVDDFSTDNDDDDDDVDIKEKVPLKSKKQRK